MVSTFLRNCIAERRLLAGIRWLQTFWLGMASMFVLLVIRLAISGRLETILFDQLILLLFPVYYLSCFSLLLSCFVLQMLLWLVHSRQKIYRYGAIIQLVCLSLLVIDYYSVYATLTDMLLPLGSPRTQAFRFYHRLTEILNLVLFCGILLQSLLYRKNVLNHEKR